MDARQAAYLRHLGVDVWVPRRRPGGGPQAGEHEGLASSARDPSPLPTAQPIPPERVDAPDVGEHRASPAADAAFRIRCFRYGRVFVALAEDAWPWRRFLLDVARAMNGFDVAERQDLVFDWPQPGADPGGGGRAFRAFLGHQTRNGERSLMSGQRVLDLVGGAEGLTDATGVRIYVPPGAPDAEAKKRLWDRIRNL
ncbi:MAG: hypothetical protein OXH15_19795 [Gammaproteobacteria bacterium]|nr:hypothetical protein [Gammaproteobacteria bacterium]